VAVGDGDVRGPRGLRPRPRSGIGSWPWIAIGLILSVAGNVLLARTSPCDGFHLAVQLSGSDQRLANWIGSCPPDLGAARTSIGWDFLYIAGYAVLGTGILRRWWPLFQAPRLKSVERVVIVLPVVVGGLDVVENLLVLAGLGVEDGRFAYPSPMALPITIASVAWTKWLLAVIALVAVAMALMLAFARRNEPHRPVVQHSAAPESAVATAPAGLGVCCSGGGIRAAAFSLGALDRLESAGLMSRARWLTAVSGGAYAATAWRLVRAAAPERPAAADIIDWLETPPPGSPHGRHRFLRNGPGGLGRPVFAALLYIGFNLVVLGALVYALSWPLGRIIGSDAVQPVLRETGQLPDQLVVPAELWLPGLLVASAGAVVLAVSALPSWRVATWWRLAAVLGAIGLVLEVFLVVIPVAMVAIGNWMSGGTASARASWVGFAAVAGVVGSIWRLVSRPIVGHFQSRLPELGGLLLVVAAVVWGGKVATDAALDAGTFRSPALWAIVTVAFVVVYAFLGTSQFSIHRIYRKRLRRTFGLARDDSGALYAPGEKEQLTWDELPDEDPELVLCCAQERTGIAPGGLPAETFTISRREIRIGEDVVPTDRYLGVLPGDLAVERCVSSWIATSGAAFASAMGRMSKGSTNALMAATNIDLGIWLPNPRVVTDPNTRFPRVRLGYLLKEILGWYDPADRYVFVADGGHWENLGLVELLRRRCRTILCLDASGDSVGAFTTLRQAVELAGLELPDVVEDIDLTGLDTISGGSAAMPGGLVATLAVTYRGTGEETCTGSIYYAKAQVASSLDIALRRYAAADRRFPNYSTGDQFLRDEQFRQLVELGRAAGDELAKRAAADAT
jgi:hypothetical protein